MGLYFFQRTPLLISSHHDEAAMEFYLERRNRMRILAIKFGMGLLLGLLFLWLLWFLFFNKLVQYLIKSTQYKRYTAPLFV